MPRQNNFGQTKTPYLFENLLDDVAPVDVTGRRVVRPSRRGFIRLGSGLVAAVLVPTVSACSEDAVSAVLTVLKAAFSITEAVAGDTLLVNEGNETRYIDSLFYLAESFTAQHNSVDMYQPPSTWALPPGDSVYPYGDLWAERSGQHIVDLLMEGLIYSSDKFLINA